jgi:hypothetical protein
MDDFLDLGFKIPEKCTSYTVRLRHSVVDKVDNLLAGASRSVLIESLLKKWIESITARRRERERQVKNSFPQALADSWINHEVDSADSLNG